MPFSWIYGLVVWLRNVGYNSNVISSWSPPIKTIVIGNLSLGGTGKTPHAAYLLELLGPGKTAFLSRGYGRMSGDTIEVKTDMPASVSGDEPLLMAFKFPKARIVADAKRKRGLEYLSHFPETDTVILDDALQHRKIKGGLNILLTTWQKPFFEDHYIPAGDLRDSRLRAKDADIMVVTKCPDPLPADRKDLFRKKLRQYNKPIFFSAISYNEIVPVNSPSPISFSQVKDVLLVTGIAKPAVYAEHVAKHFNIKEHFQYRDHHQFTHSDLQRFRNFIGSFAPGQIAILTTEKDAMRLKPFVQNTPFDTLPLFYWAISVNFGEDQNDFDKLIREYANKP